MKKLLIAMIMIFVGITSCVKDEDLKDPTPVGGDSSIFLNELVSTGDPDYVELYNSSDESVDISGYTISDGGADFVIPSGISVDAKGYLILLADKSGTVDEKGVHTNFKISSKGEPIKLVDKSGALVDQIDLPPMDPGTAYGRTSDGGAEWALIVPSPGAANSNTKAAPIVTVDSILNLNDNAQYTINAQVVSFAELRSVKLFYKFDNNFSFIDMAPLGGSDYAYTLPLIPAGTEMEYYIVATDEDGLKTYFPESAPENPLKVISENGYAIFSNFNISTENPAGGEDVKITVEVFDASGIDQVRLYYVYGDQTVNDKEKIVMEIVSDNTYEGVIPGQAENTVVSYYMRAEDLSGLKSYYPTDENFDNDSLSMWLSYKVAPPATLDALVINEIQGKGDPDFIELYNGTSADIDLGGYKLHDKDPSEAYEIPAGTIIKAGEFWTLDCDGSATTQFKVSSGGENITLLDNNGNVLDELLADNWPVDHVGLVGRYPDGGDKWVVLSEETKGSSNIK